MKVYRLKHIPTGLYFCPSRELTVRNSEGKASWVKSNLSEDGKVYTRKPSFKYLGEWIYDHTEITWGSPYDYGGYTRANPSRLEIVESDWIVEEGGGF